MQTEKPLDGSLSGVGSGSLVEGTTLAVPDMLGAGGVLSLMHGQGAGISVLKPFSEPLCLVEGTHVAGTGHVREIRERAKLLQQGDRLRLQRDAANKHDRWSIRVLDGRGQRLGFVPVDKNEILARLLDGGKHVYGQVTDVEQRGSWTRIGMDVYLDD